jgi:excinuclease ABC subunit C
MRRRDRCGSRCPERDCPKEKRKSRPPRTEVTATRPRPSLSRQLQKLREHVRGGAENRPGIYRMVGPGGEPLYVGKSIRVRTRLLSYFRAEPDEKAGELIRSTERIHWDYVPNEFAALVQEMKLIQRWRPRYNVEHKRKRRYAFVKITSEPAPRVLAVRRIAADGSTYFGPFPAAGRIAQTIRDLGHVLRLRDCAGATPMHFGDQLELLATDRSPGCLRADTSTCLGPCCGRATEGAYREHVELARHFLEGTGFHPLVWLEERMRAAASRLEFEYAARLRDRMDRLQRFRDEMVAFRGRVESLSFVYRVRGYDGDDRLYLIRNGRIRDSLAPPRTRRDRLRTAARVDEVFNAWEPGPGGLQADEAAEILLVARWFKQRPLERRSTVKPGTWLSRLTPRGRSAPPPPSAPPGSP